MIKHPIYKTKFGFHIDLSKIVSISPFLFDNKMGMGGYFCVFYIDVQLCDHPIEVRKHIRDYTMGSRLDEGNFLTTSCARNHHENYQDLIEQWENYYA